jgi:poly [ADP-ribose] polymerase 1
MVKKFKSEPKDEVDTAAENNLEEKIKKQNKIMYKIRDKLEALCSKSDLQNILFANNSCMIEGVDGLRDRCADILTFGALEKCNKCGKGDFIFARHGYKCNGMIDEWTKCGNFQEKPDRIKCKIPSALKGEEGGFFAKYKSKVENRAVRPAPVDVSKKLNKSMDSNEPRVQRKREPLYNMHVVIIGETSQPREDLKRKIEKMGGKLVTKIQEKIAVVISNAEEVEKMNSRIRMVKDFDIQVVPEKFIDEIVGLSPTETIEKIKSMSICKWGSDPLSRIPTEEERHHRESIYEKKSGSSSKVQIKLKNGTAIDPESGLDDVAHVYKHDGVLYTSVMSKTDIEKNLNSFYKLQVLEADNGRDFWVFRSWGRIGTTIGNTKIENFHSADAAVEEFERLFEEKTGNMFNSSIPFKKHKDKFCIVEVDYDEDKKVKEMSEKSSIPSKLNKKVQEVVKMLFDIDTMKQTMLEFELDLDKMPLGRLSSQQLKQAYQVLTQLSELVAKGASSNEFIGLSNKFFTLIPHNFGMKKAPIIDTMEEIKNKTDILDNLIEVEIAYSLLKDEGNEDSNPIDYHYSQLKTDMTPLKHDSEEFQLLEKYVKNTHAATHKEYSLEVLDVFAINRQGEKRRYKPFKKLHNRQLLWHGSRLTNYVGILSHGLKIAPPEAPVTGYMFGKGIYFADMVSKSANYCFTNKANNVGFMLLSEVALGDMHELTKAQSSIQKPPNGKHSVKGVGKTQPDSTQSIQRDGVTIPLGNSVTNDKLKSDLLYNEYIVYDVAQVNVQYMLKMKFNYHKK